MTKSIQFRGVYYLESQNPNFNPIAIRPSISPPDFISWEDTSNGRILHFSEILIDGQKLANVQPGKLPESIEIKGTNNQVYKLVKLTTTIFYDKLIGDVAGGQSLNFQNDEELQEYYLKADFYTAG